MRSFAVPVIAVALLAGCSAFGPTKQEQLEGVAKDWSLTIRASQVMPVYPLTEDLQPGDIFLVRVPIEQQQVTWNQRGFLPLDNHVARLNPDGYCAFYDHSFLASPDTTGVCDPKSGPGLPEAWRSPGTTGAGGTAAAAWQAAPHAGFPTYSFSVKSSGGLNLAVPVSGVPVGLGLLGADAAEGTISIGKARTLGVDQLSLFVQVAKWAAGHADYLQRYTSQGRTHNYLRVVTRIYLTGQLDVSLRDASSRSGGADVGVPKPVAAQLLETPKGTQQTAASAAKNYAAALGEINRTLAPELVRTLADGTTELLPGGSLRVTSVSARTISMKETLDPPLVIGYLGFDCEIGQGGTIGPPVPTLARLQGQLSGEAELLKEPVAAAWGDSFYVSIYELLRQQTATDAGAKASVAKLDALAELVPATATTYSNGPGVVLRENNWSAESKVHGYDLFRQWMGYVDVSIQSLQDALAKGSDFTEVLADGSKVNVAAGSPARQQLTERLESFQHWRDDPVIVARHAEARESAVSNLVRLLNAGDGSK